MLSVLFLVFLVCLIAGTVWAVKAARGAVEILFAVAPVGLFVASGVAGGVAAALAGHTAGLVVSLVGEVTSLLVLVAIGNRLRSRRMQEVIDAA